jgi:hypothetical protein
MTTAIFYSVLTNVHLCQELFMTESQALYHKNHMES